MGAAADLVAALTARGCTSEPRHEHALHGMSADCWVPVERLVEAARAAREAGFFYESLTCVDRIDPHGVFELLYTFNRFDEPARTALRVWVEKDATAPSLSDVYGIAAWNEREVWEFYGLVFTGHPNLTWLLLPEDTEFHPLLKSFTAPPPSIYDDSLNPPAPDADEQPASHGP